MAEFYDGDDAETCIAELASDQLTADDARVDQEMEEILAFEEARMRGWKRRSAALLAALRRHHPERDPARQKTSSQKLDGQARDVVSDPSREVRKTELPVPSLRPIRNAARGAAHVLADGLSRGPRRAEAADMFRADIGIADIKQAVCHYYRIAPNELISARRAMRLTRARHVAMYVAKTITARSFPEIGRQFGDRDHTTVMHAVRKIEGDLDAFRDEIAAICSVLKGLT